MVEFVFGEIEENGECSSKNFPSTCLRVDWQLVWLLWHKEIWILGIHWPFNFTLAKRNNDVTCWILHTRHSRNHARSTDKLLLLTHADTKQHVAPWKFHPHSDGRKVFKLRKMCELNLSLRALNVEGKQPSLLTMRFLNVVKFLSCLSRPIT